MLRFLAAATERRMFGFCLPIPACLLVVSALASTAPATAEGQAVSRTVQGTVRDSAGHPLENAAIALDPTGAIRATRADAQGRFRFVDVNPGQYSLRATWVGYEPVDRTILVPRDGLEVAIILARLPFQLDTMTIIARRTGIIGTAVQKSSFVALGGVDVEVLGRNFKTRTDADGSFAFPQLREGSYVLVGKRSGFASVILPVPVPTDEAVEVALALDSAATKAQQRENYRLQDMKMRWNRESASTSAIVGRHELLSARNQSLDVALRYAPSFLYKGIRLESVECIYVDGVPQKFMSLKDYPADAVAMVEVYSGGGSTATGMATFRQNGMDCGVAPSMSSYQTATMTAGKGAQGTVGTPGRRRAGTSSVVYIWLKK
jgi:Carboxypeptidase regulatory-like domain